MDNNLKNLVRKAGLVAVVGLGVIALWLLLLKPLFFTTDVIVETEAGATVELSVASEGQREVVETGVADDQGQAVLKSSKGDYTITSGLDNNQSFRLVSVVTTFGLSDSITISLPLVDIQTPEQLAAEPLLNSLSASDKRLTVVASYIPSRLNNAQELSSFGGDVAKNIPLLTDGLYAKVNDYCSLADSGGIVSGGIEAGIVATGGGDNYGPTSLPRKDIVVPSVVNIDQGYNLTCASSFAVADDTFIVRSSGQATKLSLPRNSYDVFGSTLVSYENAELYKELAHDDEQAQAEQSAGPATAFRYTAQGDFTDAAELTGFPLVEVGLATSSKGAVAANNQGLYYYDFDSKQTTQIADSGLTGQTRTLRQLTDSQTLITTRNGWWIYDNADGVFYLLTSSSVAPIDNQAVSWKGSLYYVDLGTDPETGNQGQALYRVGVPIGN